ncbi:DUF4861 domain-containing protein [Aquiflexum sp. LQ15W]|uniref:DUF4861 domain-containing protein n=1 Tax=Cognataquiflexum nitidum TaxID=2922272 RepID=UPI001F133578|nr:DUF4861 domain-containing protein [Cognataquiflexum nitidum]MCH6198922.1 DUF4861 domain-containing protein [Cognataquiflexum nitidum]
MIIAPLLLLISCFQAPLENNYVVNIENTEDFDLKNKPVLISRSEFQGLDPELFPLLLSPNNDTIPVQVDDLDGDGSWDELFFVFDIKAMSKEVLELKWSKNKIFFDPKVAVRFGVRASEEDIVRKSKADIFYPNQLPGMTGYQPYQTDGPSWENDMVGFRHYLDGRNSKDVFGKKVRHLTPDNVGINDKGVTEDNYHVMEEWGRDILSVGNSVGIGGFGLKVNDQLHRIGVTQQDTINNVEKTHFNIISDGPIRAITQYFYENWHPQLLERSYNVYEKNFIWPGDHYYKVRLSFPDLVGDEQLVIGLVNSRTEKQLNLREVGDFVVLFTHDLQTYEKEWYLGLGLILPKEDYEGFFLAPQTGSLSGTFLARMNIKPEKILDYYAVAAWELSDESFRDENHFENYMISLARMLTAKPIVSVSQK